VNVYNMGIPSIGPPEYLYLLQTEALSLHPDLIVINIFVGNDIIETIRSFKHGSRFNNFFDREAYLLYLVTKRMIKISAERGKCEGVREVLPAKRYNSVEEAIALCPWVLNPLEEEPHHSEEKFLEIESARAWFTKKKVNQRLFDSFFAVMEMIIKAAGDVPLAVMLIPDEFQAEDAVWHDVLKMTGNKLPNRFYAQERIKAWLDERDIPYLDLLPIMRAEPPLEDGQLHLYHLRDTHINARGNELVGKSMAEFLSNFLEP
jgi:hypothetical protein